MSGAVEILLTENIRHWIRTVLLTADLPNEMRDELRKYSGGTRRCSGGEDNKRHRTIPFELVRSVYDLNLVKGVYLHELLEGTDVNLPEPVIPPRDPELEARVQKLRAEAAEREYSRMTAKFQPQKRNQEDEPIGKQLQFLNRQLLTVFNFVLTVAGSFAFAYKATEYAMETPNVPVQLCAGLLVGTLVFIADIYFIIKNDM